MQIVGWDDNIPKELFSSGYGTPEHIAALQKYGATPLHRRTFIGHFVPVEEK